MPVKKEINDNFFKRWSSEMSYVLGFFAADGSMIRNKRGGCYVEFQVTDRQILVDIRNVFGSKHKISCREKQKSTHKYLYRLQVGSKEMFADLTALGFVERKTKIQKFPEVPKEYLGDFVRGYFDGDGCVYFKKLFRKNRNIDYVYLQTLFTAGNKEFLQSLHKQLHRFGLVGGSLVKKERGLELKFSKRDSLALHDFMYNNGCHCSIYLRRKKQIFDKAIKYFKHNAGVA